MIIHRTAEMSHPILANSIKKIQIEIIDPYNIPMRVFETGRQHDRHEFLINKGKTKDIISRHLYNLENDPPLYSSAVDYVYFDQKWSWNLRNSTILSWYQLFGNLVSDLCPELNWGGVNRIAINYCHFELKKSVIIDNLDKIQCVVPL